MFSYIGHANTIITLDLFSDVTSYSNIFHGFRIACTIYVKDTTVQEWIINNSDNSSLTTSNVLVKS